MSYQIEIGGKADAQLDLLTDYFNAQKIGEVYNLPKADIQNKT